MGVSRTRVRSLLRRARLLLVLAGCFVLPMLVALAQNPPAVPSSVRPPAGAASEAVPPVNLLPKASDAEVWAQIRKGGAGFAVQSGPMAPVLIQSEGEVWRDVRNGPYRAYAGWFLIGVVVAIAVFYLLRGRIRLEHPPTGVRVRRFGWFERFTHWLTAVCFVVLAVTGLSLMYGRELVLPVIGKEAFAVWSMWGKLAHNYLAFGFMLGLALMFVQWVWFNLPNRHDLAWLLRGGGLFGGGHPPARKFNAGQKILFWLVILGGLSLSLSGLQLLFPYQFHFFRDTFATLNSWFGTGLPTELGPLAEQQLAVIWHGTVAVFLIGVILGHIYIGTLGMEGAIDAMWEGEVDLEWAREHHNLWVEELERRGVVAQPAE
ncbi:Formate dehydrogenase, nitrate-inducible, cytochrome b556(Fdn) subunit [bacterium HR40]|nr:Formate dehydrogenase, nitrate-inducible, cytochrome b556(Fdn) subunit [bacterium HR40]